jgi:acetate kinase
MTILSINAGSSSLKFALYIAVKTRLQSALLSGQFEHLEVGASSSKNKTITLKYTLSEGAEVRRDIQVPHACDPFDQAITVLKQLIATEIQIEGVNTTQLQAVAHRVVHGGASYLRSVIVDSKVMLSLRKLNSLAPLHQPHNLAGIEAFQRSFPLIPQIACFDTSFHATLPLLDTTFGISNELTLLGVRRYGFHGLSYQYVITQLTQLSALSAGRAVLAHLGNGASLCATKGHQSVATTMGFSALDGLMMGTRCGALDPGVLLYLLSQGKTEKDIETMLYKQSGLLGVSGISADVRTLRLSKDPKAQFALELFEYRVIKEMGALVAVLGGVDLICFTGGIGEHDSKLRSAVCERLSWLGIIVDEDLNLAACANQSMSIHSKLSRVQVWVIPTDEGRVAAQEALALTEC